MNGCSHCGIDLPARRELPAFTAEVMAERARLAMIDPEGEYDHFPVAGTDSRATWEPSELPAEPWYFAKTYRSDGTLFDGDDAWHEYGAIPRTTAPKRYPLEADPGAVMPIDGVRARAILLHLAEPEGRRHRATVARSSAPLDQRAILERLGADLTKGRGMVRCPAHEDRAASLSWRWDGEKALLHDFAGCTFDEIRGAL